MKLKPKRQTPSAPRRRQIDNDIKSFDADVEHRYTFRRNRTLTGSASSAVHSAAEKTNAQIKSPRLQAHDLKRKRRNVVTILAVVLLSVILLMVIISQLIVKPVVSLSGEPGVEKSNDLPGYDKTITKYLIARPAERFVSTVNRENLLHFVEQSYPEVQDIKIGGSNGLGRVDFTVTPRKPVVSWTIDGQRQFVDQSGVAFVKSYYPAPGVEIVDESGIDVQSGRTVASNRFLGFIGKIVGLSATKGLVIEKVIIPHGTTRQIEVMIKGRDFPIKLSVDRAVGEQVEDITRTLAHLDKTGLKVQYIDIRVKGKAYYK